ncbi:unnamed protein product, partial [Prunus brigantina]
KRKKLKTKNPSFFFLPLPPRSASSHRCSHKNSDSGIASENPEHSFPRTSTSNREGKEMEQVLLWSKKI